MDIGAVIVKFDSAWPPFLQQWKEKPWAGPGSYGGTLLLMAGWVMDLYFTTFAFKKKKKKTFLLQVEVGMKRPFNEDGWVWSWNCWITKINPSVLIRPVYRRLYVFLDFDPQWQREATERDLYEGQELQILNK